MAKWIEVPSKDIRKWVSELIDSGKYKLLSTISAYQEAENIFIVYHFMITEGVINVRTVVPLAEPRLPSITPGLPAAILYEREIQDILGVSFGEIIDGRRLILPEQWPQGVYPLRKDFQTPKEEQYK